MSAQQTTQANKNQNTKGEKLSVQEQFEKTHSEASEREQSFMKFIMVFAMICTWMTFFVCLEIAIIGAALLLGEGFLLLIAIIAMWALIIVNLDALANGVLKVSMWCANNVMRFYKWVKGDSVSDALPA